MFSLPSWCLDLLDFGHSMYTPLPLPYPLREPVMSHCQIQSAYVLALLALHPATRCSPWYHLAVSNGQLGQVVLMPGSPPARQKITISVCFFFSLAFILMKDELPKNAKKQHLLHVIMSAYEYTHTQIWACLKLYLGLNKQAHQRAPLSTTNLDAFK